MNRSVLYLYFYIYVAIIIIFALIAGMLLKMIGIIIKLIKTKRNKNKGSDENRDPDLKSKKIEVKPIPAAPDLIGTFNPFLAQAGEGLEYSIARQMNTVYGYHFVARNVILPHKGRTSECDVILVHEIGVIVVEAKDYSGWIFGSWEDAMWTETFRTTKQRFYNPIKQNQTHIRALRNYLGLAEEVPILSYIVFSSEAELKKRPVDQYFTRIMNEWELRSLLDRDIRELPPVLTPERIEGIREKIIPLMSNQQERKQMHVDNMRGRYGK